MINKTSPISFNGLKVEGVISVENMKKFGEFATAFENTRFIKDIEERFNTNMVLNNTLTEISFSHNIYGNLSNYECPRFAVADFYSKAVDALTGIQQSIKKAEKSFELRKQECEKTLRGC